MNESEIIIHSYPNDVVLQIDQEDESSYVQAAESINKSPLETMVIVQHEYNIYGGPAGKYLLSLLDKLKCPVIVTMHTVVSNPNRVMKSVTKQILAKCDSVVTLTESSNSLLSSLYPAESKKVATIKHGIHPLLYKPPSEVKPRLNLENHKVLLTFGLLSRIKGIEYVISALPRIIEQIPDIIYLIVGRTHPGVIRKEGEAYRFELIELVKDLSIEKHVRFIPEFLPVEDILKYLQATDIYIASPLDPEQAVSGTLSYALGSGRAVIATDFAQAKEIVHHNVGRIVPFRDSEAISKAVIELFSKPKLLQTMNHAAYSETRSMLWSNVADDYASSIASVVRKHERKICRWPSFNWKHLEALTNDFGILQYAERTEPKYESGHTLDDNSRALQVIQSSYDLGVLPKDRYDELSKKYMNVMKTCLLRSQAANYLSAETHLPTDQNFEEDLSDSIARAFYALQTVKYTGSKNVRQMAVELLDNFPSDPFEKTAVRSEAQILLGASFALQHGDKTQTKLVNTAAKRLIQSFRKNSTTRWRWFDKSMTYANGHLPSSLIEAARATKSAEYRKIGLESLEFLCKTCFMGDVYAPIGESGWRVRDKGSRALFDQQPEDAFSMMLALQSAYDLTGSEIWAERAEKVFSWFMGNNLIGKRIYDDASSGCHDGLTPNGVNLNEGTESLLSYLNARLIMEKLGEANSNSEHINC